MGGGGGGGEGGGGREGGREGRSGSDYLIPLYIIVYTSSI